MTWRTLEQTVERIAEHVRAHRLRQVRVILHGGEPLLVGKEFLVGLASVVRRGLPAGTSVGLAVQTNGTRLDENILRALREHGFRVGVSLDGGRTGHDRHRRHGDGRGSYDDVARALRLLRSPANRELFSGLLCTIDLGNDPIGTYEALLEFAPPAVDFLLPHGNWTAPPPGRVPDGRQTPYADWLIPVFDRWYGAPRQTTTVRLFQEIVNLVLGGRSRSELVGLSPVALAIIDADGSIEQVDALRSAYHGASGTGLNVFDHTFDEVLGHPAVAARQAGVGGLCEACQRCPIRQICGGGFYPHRYRAGHGFQNPSVYCPDLQKLIGHIRGRVLSDLRDLVEATR
jgi:uncharacterized protein